MEQLQQYETALEKVSSYLLKIETIKDQYKRGIISESEAQIELKAIEVENVIWQTKFGIEQAIEQIKEMQQQQVRSSLSL